MGKPTLIRQVTVKELNEEFRTKGDTTRVVDANGNDVVDEGDEFIIITHQRFSWMYPDSNSILKQMCASRAPHSSRFKFGKGVAQMFEKHGVMIDDMKTEGLSYQELLFRVGEKFSSIQSFGAWVSSNDECQYNMPIINIELGNTPDTIVFHFTDATGPHATTLNLITGQMKDVN